MMMKIIVLMIKLFNLTNISLINPTTYETDLKMYSLGCRFEAHERLKNIYSISFNRNRVSEGSRTENKLLQPVSLNPTESVKH